MLDELEFERIFIGIKGNWNSHEFDILKSILRDADKTLMIDISLAFNTIQKDVLTTAEQMHLPFYSAKNQNLMKN